MPLANNNGVALQFIGDTVEVLLNRSAPPSGPDAAGRFTVSGTHSGATVVFEKVNTLAEYTAAAWTVLPGVIRQDTYNALANGTAALATNAGTDFVVGSVYGFYAVRMRLAAIGSGGVVGVGQTLPGSLVSPAAVLANMNLELTRLRYALSALTGTDLSEITAGDSL